MIGIVMILGLAQKYFCEYARCSEVDEAEFYIFYVS